MEAQGITVNTMDRIIVVNCHKILSAEQLNTIRRRVIEQLPAEGYVVVIVPEGITVQEIGAGAQRVDNYDGPDVESRPDPGGEQTMQSPTGKPIEHTNTVDFDDPIRYVWLTRAQTTEDQRLLAISHDPTSKREQWAIPVDLLTAEDQAKFADQVREL
jgi:hypothetical protein